MKDKTSSSATIPFADILAMLEQSKHENREHKSYYNAKIDKLIADLKSKL